MLYLCPAMTIEMPWCWWVRPAHSLVCLPIGPPCLPCPTPRPSVAWQEPSRALWVKIGSSPLTSRGTWAPCMLTHLHPCVLSLKTDTSTEDGGPPRMLSGPQTSGHSYSMWLAHKVLRCKQPHTEHREEIKMRACGLR